MPNSYPEHEDPFDGLHNEDPSSLQDARIELEVELLKSIHDFHQAAQVWDEYALDASSSLGKIADNMEIRRYILPHDEDDELPLPYHELEWRPSFPPRSSTALLDKITVHIPLVYEPGLTEEDGPPAETANDAVVKILYKSGVAYQFLFNTLGITPFKEPQDVAVLSPKWLSPGQDALTIRNRHSALVTLSAGQFRHMLRDSEMQLRSVNASDL